MKSNVINAVLFDLDGTLIDSNIDFSLLKTQLGISKSADILGHIQDLESQLARSDSKTEQESLTKAIDKAKELTYKFELTGAKDSKVYSGVKELLNFLQAKGIFLGVITRNNRMISNIQIEPIQHFFKEILTREDVSKPKPYPEAFTYFEKKYGLDSNKTLYIGNYIHDHDFAMNSKLAYLEYGPKASLLNSKKYTFHCYKELLNKWSTYLEKNTKRAVV